MGSYEKECGEIPRCQLYLLLQSLSMRHLLLGSSRTKLT